MKHKIQKVELFIGVIIFLGGLLTYGLGVRVFFKFCVNTK